MDLIDRKSAFAAINNNAHKYPETGMDWKNGYLIGLAEAYSLIRDLPSVQSEPQWIPCEEALPKYPCLVCDANGNTPYVPTSILKLADEKHGEWAIDGKWYERIALDGREADMLIYENRIIAWTPLPEPYDGGGK